MMNPLSLLSRITMTWVLVFLSSAQPVRAEPSPVPGSPGQGVEAKCAPSPGIPQESVHQAVSSSAAVLDSLDYETEFKDFNHLLETIKAQLTRSHTPKIQQAARFPGFVDSWTKPTMRDQYLENAKSFKLTPKEFLAIYFYSSSGRLGSTYISSILSSGDKEDIAVIQPLITLMDSGLNKLPDYKGEVRRGATIVLGQTPGDELKGYKPGKITGSKIFMSSTARQDVTYTFKRHNTHFKIISKHGKDISKLSSMSNEQEVLFSRGTKYKVLRSSLPSSPGSPIEIEMEEVESKDP